MGILPILFPVTRILFAVTPADSTPWFSAALLRGGRKRCLPCSAVWVPRHEVSCVARLLSQRAPARHFAGAPWRGTLLRATRRSNGLHTTNIFSRVRNFFGSLPASRRRAGTSGHGNAEAEDRVLKFSLERRPSRSGFTRRSPCAIRSRIKDIQPEGPRGLLTPNISRSGLGCQEKYGVQASRLPVAGRAPALAKKVLRCAAHFLSQWHQAEN